jgi:hypothetical protein
MSAHNPTGGCKLLTDVIVALLITIVAIVLGIVVHPLLFFVVVLAIVYLFARHRSRGRSVI